MNVTWLLFFLIKLQFGSACGDRTDACNLSLRQEEETARQGDWQVLRRDLDQLRGEQDGTDSSLPASGQEVAYVMNVIFKVKLRAWNLQ